MSLTKAQALEMFESSDLIGIGMEADQVRRKIHPEGVVTYIIDRNINYTNFCTEYCTFCAFYRPLKGKLAKEGYILDFDTIYKKIEETVELGGTGVLMQGGLHPDFGIEWYENLLSTLHARYPKFQLHCFSPPEIHNIHLISGLDYETILRRLKAAGLNSLPGGGGEILDDEVRKRVSTKCTTAEWLDVMRAVHKVGLISTATMMFGIGDRVEHRVRHLERVRQVQDEALAAKADDPSRGEFTAFIPWTFQRENTALGRKITEEPTGIDYLQMLAVSRLFLDNIQHIQASWLTQGLKLGQTALRFGADDMGSIMIEENVVSAAGAQTCANEAELRYQIREAGYKPQQRDILYNYVDRDAVVEMDTSTSTPLKKLSVAFAD